MTAAASAAPKPGLWTRYRAQYAKMPPAIQMIGLQLWLPVFFVLAFALCYIYAFHAPSPHDVPIGIVGSGSAVASFADTLQSNSHGALTVHTVSSLATARAEVTDGTLAAAYVPGASQAHLVVASGAQFQLASIAKEIFAPVAAAQHATLVVQDVAALPARDSFGTSVFYLTLVWIIGAYMPGMFVGLMGANLRHRSRLAIIAGASVLLPLLSTGLVHLVGAVDGHFWALWGLGAATAFAVGLLVNGLSYFFGRFVTGVALFVFVFLNVPASGGAYPPELVPQPFRFLHDYVIGTGTLDVLRRVLYGVGPEAWHGWLLIGAYAVVGIVLTVVGRVHHLHRTARRKANGAPPSMMVAAQTAAMAANGHGAAPAPEAVDEDAERTRLSEFGADEAEEDAVAAVTGTA
jgi:hypothetical protein